MAQFQKGSQKSLERHLGIVYGYIGADDFDPAAVLTIAEGEEVIITMATEITVSDKEAIDIYKAMKEAGVCPNLQAVARKITSIALPDNFFSRWHLRWEHFDSSSTIHGSLVGKIQTEPEIEDLVSALALCDSFFQDELMSLGEAVYILKEVIEKIPPEADGEDVASTPN